MSEQKKELTGYPSIDKPWLKYYTDDQIKSPIPNCSLYEYLYEKNKEYLNDFALDYFGHKISYGRLFEMIENAARSFSEIGVKPNDIVTLVTVSTVTSIVCFYALNKIGAVSNYVNVLSEEKELVGFFKEAKSEVVVSLDLFADKVIAAAKDCSVKKIVFFSISEEMPIVTKMGFRLKTFAMNKEWKQDSICVMWKDFIKLADGKPKIVYKKDPNKLALLCHTGGTTGMPKAVMLADIAMNCVADYYRQCFKYTRGQVWGNIMIPFVVYGILVCMHMPLCLGLTIAIIPKFESKDWVKYLSKFNINYILGVPSYIGSMLRDDALKGYDMSNLLLCGVGGDGMNAELEQKINLFFANHGTNIEILKGYGMSEVCGTAVTGLNGINKINSVGIPLIHNNMMIYDNNSEKELPFGQPGEICLQCASRMIGYMNNNEEMKTLFRIHDDGQEWLHTGDLGYIDEDGFLFFQGRIKRVILTTGGGVAYKVYPNIIEDILDEHYAVSQSCVVGTNKDDNLVLKVFIVAEMDRLNDIVKIENELREICENKLPEYARPMFYEFKEELPLTSAGKVDYRQLEKNSEKNNK